MNENVFQKAGITYRVVNKLLPVHFSKPTIYGWLAGKGAKPDNQPYLDALKKAAETALEKGLLPIDPIKNDRYEQYLRTLVVMKKLVEFPPTQ